MKEEIKEILDDLRTYKDRYEYFLFNNLSFSDRDYKAKILLDYITNLQKEYNKQKEILDKIKEKLEKYNDKETNMYAPIQECLELLEEVE